MLKGSPRRIGVNCLYLCLRETSSSFRGGGVGTSSTLTHQTGETTVDEDSLGQTSDIHQNPGYGPPVCVSQGGVGVACS